MPLTFTSPKAAAKFTITSGAAWPSIAFATSGTGPHGWKWEIAWDKFKASGAASTTGNTWDAKSVVTDLGGTLTVTATAGKESATVKVEVVGTNPSGAEVTAYLATKPDSGGFDKILEKESKYKQFRDTGLPVKSFDGGYGMCQLTNPAPTAPQVWNWKKNIDGGLVLFAEKVRLAKNHLSQAGRTYTADQLKYEAVCRWNGGSYHEWDDKAKAWVRKTAILCDSTQGGNFGWDMTDAENKGKTEADLRARDKGSYSKPPAKGAHWQYSGVCYADSLLK